MPTLSKSDAIAVSVFIARGGNIIKYNSRGIPARAQINSDNRGEFISRYVAIAETAKPEKIRISPIPHIYDIFLRELKADYYFAAKLCG